MPVKVTITVEIDDHETTKTLAVEDDMITQAIPGWAASAVEMSIATNGAKLVRQIAALHGDMRDTNPNASGFRGAQRERPLTGTPA